MARIYRHQYADGHKSPKWYIEYRDHSGKRKRVPGFTSRKLTQQHAANLERTADRIRAGMEEPHESGPRLSLAELEEEFEASILANGRGEQHAREYRRCCEIAFESMGWGLIADLDGDKADVYLTARNTAEVEPLSADGCNHYRAAFIAFGNWLMKKKKLIATNPFTGIRRRNPEEARVHPRRTLAPKEFDRFLAAARNGPTLKGLPGKDREMLYLVAGCTGLRASALASLTAAEFRLDDEPPKVVAKASIQKNRKALEIPLPSFLAPRLRKFLRRRVGRIWPGNWAKNCAGSKLVYADLKAAKLDPETSEGWFDFHSLRHQYATMLVESGALPAEVQMLMDHSTPTLTARYFRHMKTERLAVPVERLPKMG